MCAAYVAFPALSDQSDRVLFVLWRLVVLHFILKCNVEFFGLEEYEHTIMNEHT